MSRKGKHNAGYTSKRFCGNLILGWRLLGIKEFETDDDRVYAGLKEAFYTAKREGMRLYFKTLNPPIFRRAMADYLFGEPKKSDPFMWQLNLNERDAVDFLKRNIRRKTDISGFINVARVFHEFFMEPETVYDYEKHQLECGK